MFSLLFFPLALAQQQPRPGTDFNNFKTPPGNNGYSLASAGGNAATSNASPYFTEKIETSWGATCVYSLQYALTDAKKQALVPAYSLPGSPNLRIRALSDNNRALDVAQGNIGNCAFGASILALMGGTSSTASALRDALSKQYLNLAGKGSQELFVGFYKNTKAGLKKYTMRINSQIPSLDYAKSSGFCYPYYGYQGLSGFQNATNNRIIDVPLLEKAWAKHVDLLESTLRSSSAMEAGLKGYDGLQGTRASFVMEAITGKKGGTSVARREGYTLAPGLVKCLSSRVCVIGSSPEKGEASLLTTPLGNNPNNKLQVTDNGDGSYTVVDKFNGKKEFTLYKAHAYAIVRSESGKVIDGDYSKTILRVRNPWGSEDQGPSGYQDISLKALGRVIDRIYYIDL